MNRDRSSSSNDPTAEPAIDQSTPSASGLGAGRARRDSGSAVNLGALDTPRRYDQPIEEDDDPVMPGDEATVNTKI